MNRRTKTAAALALAALVAALTGCAGGASAGSAADEAGAGDSAAEKPIGGDIVAPVTVTLDELDELDGAEIELVVGQVLNIDTGDLAVEAFVGSAEHPDIAVFVEGSNDGSAEFNPGFEALAAGETAATISDPQTADAAADFTITVSERK